ncbi:MAG: dTMP kinase [Deltaproteobacteria bacterium]|nr:dTMP kinase [Deltaproteobacteria bacterium]
MSLFITFEGIEGSGKTTQITLLKKALQKKGYSVLITREPGGTVIGDQIREVLLKRQNKKLVPLAELLLYEASRAQHVQEKIQPALKKRKIVISDRYSDATTVYQGVARALSTELTDKLNRIATENLKPHLTLVLDCPVHMGLGRVLKRTSSSHLDRIEQEKISFHRKVRQGYLRLAKKEPHRVKVIDASGPAKQIHSNILQQVLKKI